MTKAYGRATVRIDGNILDTVQGVKLDTGGIKRTTRPGSRTMKYTEELVPSKLEVPYFIDSSVSLAGFGKIDNATIMVEFDTGQTYVITGGWLTDTPTAEDGEGKGMLVFEGPPAEEMV